MAYDGSEHSEAYAIGAMGLRERFDNACHRSGVDGVDLLRVLEDEDGAENAAVVQAIMRYKVRTAAALTAGNSG